MTAYGALSFREPILTPSPSFNDPFPLIAAYWADFDHTISGEIFYGFLDSQHLGDVQNIVQQSYGNTFEPTSGFYATWDRVTNSDNLGVSYHQSSKDNSLTLRQRDSGHLETQRPWALVTKHGKVTTKGLRISKCHTSRSSKC